MKKYLLWVVLLLAGFCQQAWAQNRTISGRVIDRATNEGLPGVTVVVPGTSVGVATGADGSFSLSVPSTATELRFSSVGYVQTQQALGNGAGPYTVSLATDTKQLNEVVVTALGIEKDKKSLGYATQTIESSQLTQGRERSVLNSLQGKVAGVQINSASGGVGSSTRVVIRGNKSFGNSNQPLYVVDGIPIDNTSLETGDNLNNGVDAGNRGNDVNPEDVESVSILKGPAATVLYGSRAANGAILITTKSGRGAAKNGKKAEVTFTSSYVIDTILKLPDTQDEFGQGFPQGGPSTDIGIPYPRITDTRENTSWGKRFDGKDQVWGNIVDNQQRSKPYVALPNNLREFFDIGKTLTNTVSLGGGDAKTNYIVSASNVQQSGVTPGTKYARSSVKVGGETHLTNKITSSVSATYTRTSSDQAVTGQGNRSIYDQLIQTPRDISLLELRDLSNKFNDINGYYSPYTANPWQVLHDNQFHNDVNRLVGNTQIGYQLNNHFKANYRLGIDTYSDQRSQFSARRDPVGPNAGVSSTGSYSETSLNYSEISSDAIVTYNGNITPDLTISALVGQNYNQRRTDLTGIGTNNLVSNAFGPTLQNNANNGYLNTALTHSFRRIYGVYSTVDFGFRDYLFLGLSARNDWSSTLPASNRSFFYPGINTSFVFTELLGLKENPFFSYGKLRANYAQVGNDAPVYLTNSTFGIASVSNGYTGGTLQFPLGSTVAYSQGNRIGSNTLQPEITKSAEIGTELRFFNNRLTADVTLYDARTTKQIQTIPLTPSTGFTGLVGNAGEVQNKGIEVLLSGTPVRVGGFTWDLTLTYTKNVSKVLSTTADGADILIGGLNGASLYARVGDPYGVFRATDILTNDAGQVVVSSTGTPLTGPVKSMGTITPRYTAGLSSTFAYKGLSLTVVVDTKQGGSIYSRTRGTQRFAGTAPETTYNDRQPYIIPNSVVQNADGSYSPNTTPTTDFDYYGALEGASGPSGTNIIDASYTKLREVALSYSLPSKWLTRTPFGALSLGITGRNLLLWTAKENTYIDPENSNFGSNTNIQGYEFTGPPSLRSYGANIRVTF